MFLYPTLVRLTSVQEVLDGTVRLPSISRPAWLAIQAKCPDPHRTHAHLVQGTRSSRKLTNIRDVKRYLNVASVAADGLLVVQRDVPLVPSGEYIIVPRQVVDGLLMPLHLQLCHPTCHQRKSVVKHYLYALDLDRAAECVSGGCYTCAALCRTLSTRVEQSSSCPPEAVGLSFAADVLRRARQVIFVLRETVTAFTSTMLLSDECHESLRNALIQLLVVLTRPLGSRPW